MSLYAAETQAELHTDIVTKEIEPEEIASNEEAMLQSFIEAFLKDHENDIVETNPSVDHVYPKLVSIDDGKLVKSA